MKRLLRPMLPATALLLVACAPAHKREAHASPDRDVEVVKATVERLLVAASEGDWEAVEARASESSSLRTASAWSPEERSTVFPLRWEGEGVRIDDLGHGATYFGCGDFGGPDAYAFTVTVVDRSSWGVHPDAETIWGIYSVELSRSGVQARITTCQLRD